MIANRINYVTIYGDAEILASTAKKAFPNQTINKNHTKITLYPKKDFKSLKWVNIYRIYLSKKLNASVGGIQIVCSEVNNCGLISEKVTDSKGNTHEVVKLSSLGLGQKFNFAKNMKTEYFKSIYQVIKIEGKKYLCRKPRGETYTYNGSMLVVKL